MKIHDATVLVTGSSRGLGTHLVTQLLERGARRVYATARDESAVGHLADADERVVPLALDVTDADAVQRAAERADDVDLLINNAGVLTFGGALDTDADALRGDFETNVVGTWRAAQAFAPTLERRGGAIANVVTLIALAPVPGMAPYCVSKAATHSLTQSLRAELRPRGVAVHGFYPAGIDTDMLAGVDGPKEPPADVARALLDGIERDDEDIHPDGAADAIGVYRRDPKALERMLAGA